MKRTGQCGLVYLRRSSSQQELSLTGQLTWAIRRAAELGVSLDASTEDLSTMQTANLTEYKAIRLDDSVTGADLERVGLAALKRAALEDAAVSHVFITKRDRLGRPNRGWQLVEYESELREAGVTLVFQDCVLPPLDGLEDDLGNQLTSFVQYHAAGKYLKDHAERIIASQCDLARKGFSTGGRPPYGFGRVLVNAAGEVIEHLPDGKRVRQPGCHVRWVPIDADKIGVLLWILEQRACGRGYKGIAQDLNRQGIPSPDAGRKRVDGGVPHEVSGLWSHNAIAGICRNRILVGLREYGARSEGAHRRLGNGQHRPLTSDDMNAAGRPRVVKNPTENRIVADAGCEAIADKETFLAVQHLDDERGRSQRGVPKNRDPARYPLAMRLYDLTDDCGHPLYGRRHGKRTVHVCGRYMKSSGTECHNNSVDAEAALVFVLQTIRQVCDQIGGRKQLAEVLRTQAEASRNARPSDGKLNQAKAALEQATHAQRLIEKRLATEQDDRIYEALRKEFLAAQEAANQAEHRLRQLESSVNCNASVEEEVAAALCIYDNIERLVTNKAARAEINPLLRQLGIRLGLRFEEGLKGKKRKVRRLAGGVMVFGDADLPVPLYGPANRQTRGTTTNQEDAASGVARSRSREQGSRKSKSPVSSEQDDDGRSDVTKRHQEGTSFTKVNRGDWIRTSDLCVPNAKIYDITNT